MYPTPAAHAAARHALRMGIVISHTDLLIRIPRHSPAIGFKENLADFNWTDASEPKHAKTYVLPPICL